MKKRLLCIGAILVIVSLVLSAGLGGSMAVLAQDGTPEATAAAGLRDPKEVALEIVGGQPIGGTVSVLGLLGGAELDKFLSVFAPFEEATGIKVEYEPTGDLNTVLQTRLDGGTPPDIVSSPAIGQLAQFAKEGKLVKLNDFLDMATIQQDYDLGILGAVSVGSDLYGLFDAVNLEGLIWYNPKAYTGPNPPKDWAELQAWAQQTADSGTTPWCIGLESGAASGWPATIWITELMLRQNGPEIYDQWWRGELAWTSPEVKRAFETFGGIATDPKMVTGGSTAVLATSFLNGGDALYANPPACYLHHQASFFGSIVNGNFSALKPIEDINFFPFPDVSAEYSGLRQMSGEAMALFNDTPQSRALITYFATPEAQSLLAATGSWLSANKRVPIENYPGVFTKLSAEVLQAATLVRYDGSALMPATLNAAFTSAMLRYVQNPGDLEAILAELDAVRVEAYK